MKFARFLIPLVLLCVAVPAFALCGECDENNCVFRPGLGSRCYYKQFLCYTECRMTFSDGCLTAVAEPQPFDNEYDIISVKIDAADATAIKQQTPVIASRKLKKT